MQHGGNGDVRYERGGGQRARAEPGAAQVDASPLLLCIYPTGVIWFSVRRGNGFILPSQKQTGGERKKYKPRKARD